MFPSGLVSISLDAEWIEPYDSHDPSHVAAAERSMNFRLGWFAEPIFGDGDYPEDMRNTLQQDRNNATLPTLSEDQDDHRLPILTDEDKEKIKGEYFLVHMYTNSNCLPSQYDSGYIGITSIHPCICPSVCGSIHPDALLA